MHEDTHDEELSLPLLTLPDAALVFPGTNLSKEELHKELIRHGFSREAIAALERGRPAEYIGHRRCEDCGHLEPNLGMVMDHCAQCGWCAHAAVAMSVCVRCGVTDPPPVELRDEHFHLHYMNADGKVDRSERG